ncbi:MAG: hypothetical protein KME22_11425 [Hassallia sp. WJT32-NPBG1]|nr:hypothetical protein [Hassallia sp. WJT32-NPBG1]
MTIPALAVVDRLRVAITKSTANLPLVPVLLVCIPGYSFQKLHTYARWRLNLSPRQLKWSEAFAIVPSEMTWDS